MGQEGGAEVAGGPLWGWQAVRCPVVVMGGQGATCSEGTRLGECGVAVVGRLEGHSCGQEQLQQLPDARSTLWAHVAARWAPAEVV